MDDWSCTGEESAAACENIGAELPGLSITKGGGGDIEGTEGLWLPPWAPSLPPSALPAFSVLHSSLCSGSWNDTCEHRIRVIYLSIIIVLYFVWAIKGWKEQEKKWIRMSHSEMIITFMHISVQKVFRVKEKKIMKDHKEVRYVLLSSEAE